MATCFGVVRPLGQLKVFNIIMRNVRKQQDCHRNYTRRARRKKQTMQEERKIDIGGILSGSGASSGNKVVVGTTATKESTQDTVVKVWQGSEERTSLLRKGEKKVALIAVATMLIGFVAIKSVVYVSEKWTTPTDGAVDQPA